MKKIPKMISTKDLSYISDIFNWNLTASKKIYELRDICNNEDVCKELDNLIKIHEKNCKTLISLLESCGPNGR